MSHPIPPQSDLPYQFRDISSPWWKHREFEGRVSGRRADGVTILTNSQYGRLSSAEQANYERAYFLQLDTPLTEDPLTQDRRGDEGRLSNGFYYLWAIRYEFPIEESANNYINALNEIYPTIHHTEEPYWTYHVHNNVRYFIAVDIRNEEDEANILRVMTKANAALHQNLTDWTIDFVDARNHRHTLTALQTLKMLQPVSDWYKSVFNEYQNRKERIRNANQNAGLRAMKADLFATDNWPAPPSAPSSEARLNRIRVSHERDVWLDVLTSLDGTLTKDIEVPADTTHLVVEATAEHSGARITLYNGITHVVMSLLSKTIALTEDSTVLTIDCEAEDATSEIYSFTVNKASA